MSSFTPAGEASVRQQYEQSWSHHQHQHMALLRDGLGRLAAARELVSGGVRLLDVGCGDGAFAGLVADRFLEVSGVDVSEVALERAREQGVSTRQADLDRDGLPFADESFDFVTCLDVIEHVFDPVRLLEECYRVVSPSGRFLLTTINIRYLKFLLRLAVQGRFPKTSGDTTLFDGGHLHYFTAADLAELLEGRGFQVLRKQGIIATRRLRFLRRWTGQPIVREFFSTGVAVLARRP